MSNDLSAVNVLRVIVRISAIEVVDRYHHVIATRHNQLAIKRIAVLTPSAAASHHHIVYQQHIMDVGWYCSNDYQW